MDALISGRLPLLSLQKDRFQHFYRLLYQICAKIGLIDSGVNLTDDGFAFQYSCVVVITLFLVAVLRREAKKCIKVYTATAERL